MTALTALKALALFAVLLGTLLGSIWLTSQILPPDRGAFNTTMNNIIFGFVGWIVVWAIVALSVDTAK